MASEVLDVVGSVANSFTALVTLGSVIVATKAAKYAASQAALLREQLDANHATKMVEVHSRFQSEIREIQRKFPPNVNDQSWVPANEDERRSVTMYWYLVFDEWLTCTQMSSDLKPLWDKHYSEGVKSALRLPAFKARIEEIFRGDSSFFGYGQTFRKDIEDICYKGTGKPLHP